MSDFTAALVCAASLMGVPNGAPKIVHLPLTIPQELCDEAGHDECVAVEMFESFGIVVVALPTITFPQRVHVACHALQWHRFLAGVSVRIPSSPAGERECDGVEALASTQCR